MSNFLFPSFSRQNPRLNLQSYGIAIAIFLVGLFLSVAAFRFYKQQDLKHTHTEFERIADIRLFLIEKILLETVEQLDYLKQFFYSSTEVSKKDFHHFVRLSFDLCPNLLALAWLEKDSNVNSFIPPSTGFEFVDSHSLPVFNPLHFFPLTYLETPTFNQSFYIDNYDYTIFLNLFQKSHDQVITILSPTVDFFQEKKKQGFFMFKSVFFEDLPQSRSQSFHSTGLFGTLIGFSNFDDIIEKMKSRTAPIEINISIYDISNHTSQLLYWKAASILKDPLPLSKENVDLQEPWTRSHVLKFGNQKWKLQVVPTLEFIRQHQNKSWKYWEILIMGILISSIISSYFLVLVNQQRLIEKEVHQRTHELATINDILQLEILERQRVEEEVSKKQQDLQRYHEALDYLTKFTISEPQHAIHEVILRTANVMHIDRVSVWLYEMFDQNQLLSCIGIYILSTHSFSDRLEFNSTAFPNYFRALSAHSPLILPSAYDAELNQEISSYLAVFHITSKLDIPIIFEGNLLGILSCEETRGHREWPLEDRHFGQTIADIIAIMIVQSARRKAEKALQESEERLRFITQKAIDGIISLNDKQNIISWNLGAERIFGYNEKEILEKSLYLLIPQDISFLQNEKSSKTIELNGQHKNHHLFPIEVSHTRWKSGELNFDTLIIRDITERKENEKRLIKAMREAKAANEAKNEFLATISHELRTPLNAIIGFNQCVLMEMDGPINEQQQISLKKIEKSSFHLLNIINDVLDLAKIDAHRMELEVLPYNIVEIAISCVDEMQSLAQQKNLTLSLSIDKPFVLIEIDKIRMRQVFTNLLSNAIKFTEKGSITVKIIDNSTYLDIQVTDTGIGLSPEEIKKIFTPFSQADNSITRKYGGTGLGLAICKNIIHLHGGTIKVESQKGKGSTFIVILPKN